MDIAVLIPAYNPDDRLWGLVAELHQGGRFAAIVVVDDGSGAGCQPLFDRLAVLPGVKVLHHAANLGKGAALKTGLDHCCATLPKGCGVVTADADGQHLPADVRRVAGRLRAAPDSLVLGSRQFAGAVPLRSRLGNLATKYAFWGLAGKKLDDTQCGLRGIPPQLARQLLRSKRSGYEFELDMLVHCRQSGVPIVTCPITTVYLDANRSSHFRPIVDSLRIYAVFLRFIAASLITAAIDYSVFVVVFSSLGGLLTAQASARLAAIGVNFALARQAVFRSRSRLVWSLAKFLLLVVVMGAASYCMIRAATYAFGWNVIVAKMASELLLYLANFVIQRNFIFSDRREAKF
jgi:glycosyltransferase involved in cell wall biosynthesis